MNECILVRLGLEECLRMFYERQGMFTGNFDSFVFQVTGSDGSMGKLEADITYFILTSITRKYKGDSLYFKNKMWDIFGP